MTDSLDYFDQGFSLYQREPELLAIMVWRRAFALSTKEDDQFDFVFGYCSARRQHDEYEKDHTS
jgi:hypothetical protein